MLRRYSGIKPSHLWHKTPIKDFLYHIKRRLSAVENWEQRDKGSMLQVGAIILASGIGMYYTLGKVCTGKILDTIMPDKCDLVKEPEKTEDSKKIADKPTTKCAKKGKIEPCPPKPEPKMKPCP